MTKDLIDCNSSIDYAHFVLQKVTFEKMNMRFAKKTEIIFIFEINGNNIHITIILINQDIMMLFQIVVLRSKIWCFEIVVFLLVFYFVDVITKDEYL